MKINKKHDSVWTIWLPCFKRHQDYATTLISSKSAACLASSKFPKNVGSLPGNRWGRYRWRVGAALAACGTSLGSRSRGAIVVICVHDDILDQFLDSLRKRSCGWRSSDVRRSFCRRHGFFDNFVDCLQRSMHTFTEHILLCKRCWGRDSCGRTHKFMNSSNSKDQATEKQIAIFHDSNMNSKLNSICGCNKQSIFDQNELSLEWKYMRQACGNLRTTFSTRQLRHSTVGAHAISEEIKNW